MTESGERGEFLPRVRARPGAERTGTDEGRTPFGELTVQQGQGRSNVTSGSGEAEAQRANRLTSLCLSFFVCQMG